MKQFVTISLANLWGGGEHFDFLFIAHFMICNQKDGRSVVSLPLPKSICTIWPWLEENDIDQRRRQWGTLGFKEELWHDSIPVICSQTKRVIAFAEKLREFVRILMDDE